MRVPMALTTLLLLLLSICAAVTSANNHKFKLGDKVPMYVNKVGPYFNKHETYHYYSLPVCRPEKIIHRSLTLGEVLDGDRMAEAMYTIKFKEEAENEKLCSVTLSQKDIEKLHEAIEDLYYFEFIIDDLPVRGFIGQFEEQVLPHTHHVYLWTHIEFELQFNDDQIVAVTVNEKNNEFELVEADNQEATVKVSFTYSVKWVENKQIPFVKRTSMGKSFFPETLEIHWLSIINSAVLVVLLTGFVAIILARALHKDFARYSREDEDLEVDDDVQEDQGWKIVHADVFRFPEMKMTLCAVLGNGTQLLTLAGVIIIMALLGMFNVHRHGAMNTAAILVYAMTCGVAGYVSNRLYKQMEGEKWAWNIVLTSCTFTLPFFLIWSVVNSVAWSMGSTQALPATTIILLLLIWLFVGFPLTVIGGIVGKNGAGTFESPCRTKNIPREIPSTPFYHSTIVHLAVGGFLPFSAISVELYYIFATLWGREHYTLYGILLMVFLILIAVTACVSVALTYFQLNSEDYRWWWRSVFSAGFTGVFVFFYAVFYFKVRSNMSGTLQTVQFFGYTMLACYIFFLMLGTIGFYSSLVFNRYIYKNLKLD